MQTPSHTRLAILIPLALAACTEPASPPAPIPPPPPSALGTQLTGNTVVHFDPAHGTQVEYLGPDGKTVLWYPGNSTGVPGRWRVKDGRQVCFTYQPRSYNPVTGAAGGVEECTRAPLYLQHVREVVRGDPLGLADATIPFVLPKAGPPSVARLAIKGGIRDARTQPLPIPVP